MKLGFSQGRRWVFDSVYINVVVLFGVLPRVPNFSSFDRVMAELGPPIHPSFQDSYRVAVAQFIYSPNQSLPCYIQLCLSVYVYPPGN